MRSLTLKLTLAFLFVGLLGALLVAVFVGLRTQREFDQFISDRYQQDLVEQLADFYQQNGSWQGLSAINLRFDNEQGRAAYMRAPVALADSTQTVVLGTRRYRVGQQVSQAELRGALPVTVDGQTVGSVLLDLPDAKAPRDPYSPEDAFLARVNQAIVFGALGATVFALVLGGLLARAISRPVKELTEATQRVAGGELGHQVPVRTRDELGELAISFNSMSADLATANQLRRQMTADVAHELRTPLSVILGYTEALSDGKLQGKPAIYDAMYGEAQLLSHLVDDLRTLSLADAGELTLNRGLVAPAECLERVAASHAGLAAQRGVRLEVQIAPDLPLVDVDRERIAQVLANLVSNALRYTPEGGMITLSAEAIGDRVLLRVSDTGPGIEPQHLPLVFKRFYRADDARPANGESGLGLAIARSLVEAHGGT
ncbi:MAG TPA: ATP-binding protein, partial [Anaerolineae bacterium]|nr:ATP-binding protein [Anaerolineae bacterium]